MCKASLYASRDRAPLGLGAPTLECIDHSMRKVQLYTLVTKTTIKDLNASSETLESLG